MRCERHLIPIFRLCALMQQSTRVADQAIERAFVCGHLLDTTSNILFDSTVSNDNINDRFVASSLLGSFDSINNFFFLLNFFVLSSAFVASLLFLNSLKCLNMTGPFPLVYFAPLPELCALMRRFISVVMPVYNVPSLHSTIYRYQGFILIPP